MDPRAFSARRNPEAASSATLDENEGPRSPPSPPKTPPITPAGESSNHADRPSTEDLGPIAPADHPQDPESHASSPAAYPPSSPEAPFPPLALHPSENPNWKFSAFKPSIKYFIVSLTAVAAIISPISSNILVPAIPTLAADFHKTEEEISLAITVYLVFQAVTPSFFGSASDSFGRRPVYLVTMIVYIGANIGLALVPTNAYWLLLVLRALQATGGSAVISIGAGTISDISEPRERGVYMSFFQGGVMLALTLGPLLGGIFADTLGWRAIFWFLVIITGVVLIPFIFFMPETLRSLVGDGSIPPPGLNCSPQQLIHRRRDEKHGIERPHVDRPPHKPYEPLSAFLVLFNPEILLTFIFVSIQYLDFYAYLTVFSTTLQTSYGLNELQIGLCYLYALFIPTRRVWLIKPSGVGLACANLISGRLVDVLYRREEKRVGGDYRRKGEEFRLERTRFLIIAPGIFLFIIATIAVGWCLEARAPLAATLVVSFCVGLGSGGIQLATIYGQDLLPSKGGAVSASLNLVRCIFGAIGSAVIQLIYRAIGAGWTFVLLSGLLIIALPLPMWVMARGQYWRIARKERARQKAERTRAEVEGAGAGAK